MTELFVYARRESSCQWIERSKGNYWRVNAARIQPNALFDWAWFTFAYPQFGVFFLLMSRLSLFCIWHIAIAVVVYRLYFVLDEFPIAKVDALDGDYDEYTHSISVCVHVCVCFELKDFMFFFFGFALHNLFTSNISLLKRWNAVVFTPPFFFRFSVYFAMYFFVFCSTILAYRRARYVCMRVCVSICQIVNSETSKTTRHSHTHTNTFLWLHFHLRSVTFCITQNFHSVYFTLISIDRSQSKIFAFIFSLSLHLFSSLILVISLKAFNLENHYQLKKSTHFYYI